MGWREMTIDHKMFGVHEDLNGKANGFINDIDQLAELGAELESFIKAQTSGSHGYIIEEIEKTITEYENMNRGFHDAYKSVMRNKAKDFDLLIVDMQGQKVTLYYEVIEMNKS